MENPENNSVTTFFVMTSIPTPKVTGPVARSTRAGLVFPVGRVHRLLTERKYAKKIGTTASIYLAAVMEYVAAEILELSGSDTLEKGHTRITPRNLQLAIRGDEELDKLMNSLFKGSGGIPHIKKEVVAKQNTNNDPQE